MSTNGETADLMVREGIQITESALKLAGLGAKNLAALLIALANDNQKLAGKTNLKRLIHDGEELTIFSVKQEDLKGFQMEAKRYGVLFYPIVNKVEKTGTVEIMVKAKDAKQINRIFERMGYPAPVKEDTAAKKENARAPSENSSKERGTGARASTEPATEKADARPSVRSRLMALQAAAERDGTAPIKDTVREAIQKANILRYQQEDALNTVLPLGLKRIEATRTLTTECTAVLMPFKSQEIQDAGGIYYGVNAVSHNLIICNRGNLLNGNGFITGVSGSGKSMAAKQEVSALALSTDHDIIIVDPEREYGELVRALGGEVITISASDPNGCHINALDLSEGYGDGREPLVMKSEFIMSLYEQLMGADKIEPQEKSIIDRSVGNIYREYLKSYQGQPPTLKDLYDDLMKQVNPEAHRIALALELFTVGSLNVFSHQTNINTKSRILCFDIQDLGENLKSVGLLVMLDAIYNRVIQNRREGKYTHVYIDEIYLFFANGSGSGHSITNYSSEFLYKCWKRFRKYGATLTGITQNVEECLLSNTARMMFANSEFLLMLNQATTDREQLARLLGASDTQMSYVDNAPAGHGLIKVGGAIVPFANELPKNTELYRLMTTKPGED